MLLLKGKTLVWYGIIHVALDVFKFDPDWQVADKPSQEQEKINVTLLHRELSIWIIAMIDHAFIVAEVPKER